MPRKNKTAAKRRKFQRSRSQRSRSRRRTRTIRGGRPLWRWATGKDNRVVPETDPSPSAAPLKPWLPPSLPTNVDSVTIAAREGVSKKNRDLINDLTKDKEPFIKQRDALVANKGLLEARLEILRQDTSRENREARRIIQQQIRNEILGINTEIRSIETEIRAFSREIERTQKQDREYRENRHLPELPPDDIPDADAAMAKMLGVVDDFDLHQGKKAVGAEAVLHVTAGDLRRQFDKAMSGMSGSPRGSVQSQIDEVVKDVTRGLSRGSTPPRRSSAHGSSAHGSR